MHCETWNPSPLSWMILGGVLDGSWGLFPSSISEVLSLISEKKKNNKKPAFMSLSSLESQWGISQRTRKDLKHSGVEGWRFQSCLSLQDTLLRLILPLVCLPVRGAAEQSWSVTVPLLTECPLGSSHLSLWTRDSK